MRNWLYNEPFYRKLSIQIFTSAVIDVVRVSVIGASTLSVIGVLVLLLCIRIDNNEKRKI